MVAYVAARDMSCHDIVDERTLKKVCPAGEGGGLGPCGPRDLAGIPANPLEIVDQDLAVDDGRAHVGAAGGIDDGRVGVGGEGEVWLGAIDQDQVRLLADLDAPDFLL